MKTRPTPETDAHKRSMEHKSFLSELAKTYTLAERLEQERDEAKKQAAELLEALELLLDQFDVEIHNEYDGTRMLNSRLSEANHARAAIAKAKGGQPLPNSLDEAVQRMEAVPWEDIAGVWFALEDEKGRSRRQEVIEAIRARLIQAVKGGQP